MFYKCKTEFIKQWHIYQLCVFMSFQFVQDKDPVFNKTFECDFINKHVIKYGKRKLPF